MTPIKVTYDAKTRRLAMRVPFLLADVARSFPNRRFEPKSKSWKMPIVRANIEHYLSIRHKYDFEMSPEATSAVVDFDKLMQGPVYKPYPAELIDQLLKYPPMDHQWGILDRGWNLDGYAVFAAMGTGKTYSTIALAMARWKLGLIDRLAIICPSTLRRTWEKEFKKYAKAEVDFRYHSTSDTSMGRWAADHSKQLKVLAISVEGLGVSEKMYDAACAFFVGGQVMGVVDESSRIKNPDAKRTKRTIELGAHCKFRVALNGTPIAKGIHDLWSQYEFLDPNIIGTGDYWSFKTKYVEYGGYENRQIVGYKSVEELMGLIQPHSIEVNKKILNLPPKVYKTLYIDPTPGQRALFQKILTGIGDGHISVKNVLERMLRCQQVIGGFEPMTDIDTDKTTTRPLPINPKLNAMMDFIEANKEGTKFIIWARYVPEIEMILHELSSRYGPESVLAYYGETSNEDRARAESQYGSNPNARFLVGNPSAAGLGLTLIGGENDVMFYYSGTFAYIDRAQSEDRSHRIGQRNSVLIVDCVMNKSIDEAIIEAIAQKKDMDTFVKDWIAKGGHTDDLLSGMDTEAST